jgi:hypothetical protein|tara:strand:+ start:5073 stop:5564 length:492 start_codon:yes stop_codon:yes gene_type:complete
MALNKIEGLIEKYNDGATTLLEESQLRNYFSQEAIPAHLESYRQLFLYFESDTKQLTQRSIPLGSGKPKKIRRFISVAAALVILFTAFMNITTENDELTLTLDELYAYNETLKAFHLISNQMTKGHKTLSSLNMISSSFEKGKKNINMLGEFNNSTNKIFKIK